MPAKKTTARTASKKTTTKRQPTRKTTPKKSEPKDWIRNLRNVEVRLRFPSQKIAEDRQGIVLKPRGQRQDIARVPTPEDLNSTYYVENLGLTFEPLTASEAREIASKQATNEQAPVHPVLAALRNELGKEYEEGAVQLEVPYEQQGKVVATVNMQGQQVVVDRNPVGPQLTEVPGSQVPEGIDAEQLRDSVARSKTIEGPKAGLAGIRTVTVEDVQRS